MTETQNTRSLADRPKRDAAKKFLNGVDSSAKADPPKKDITMNLRQVRKPTKEMQEAKETSGAKKAVAHHSSTSESDKKKHHSHDNLPAIAVDKGIRKLDLSALKKYKRHFGLKTGPASSNKEDLQAAVIKHFANVLRADASKVEKSFLKRIRDNRSK
mmetsp:Transcript_22937/g.74800  ORF Transcript_22937/g.74800 Transcript_22937/m.74800 type:complete len:158 (-) Transcript_22937:194-667(-)